ncbi:MAG: hypothetical protein ACRDF6_09315 [bacterium]
MATPTLVLALGLCATEAWRIVRPQSPLFATPLLYYSFGDAIAAGDVWQAYQFIRSGQDPNELIAVRHPALTGGQWVFVSPLVWATATQNTQAVQMLLGFGARMERAADRRAVCLAQALGNEEIARVLRAHDGGRPTEGCGDLELDEAPLLRLLAGAE